MPVFHSQQLIDDLSRQTQHFLHEATQQWQQLPPDVMLHRQTPQQWSAAQCLAHLNSYGVYYLPAIQKTIDDATSKQWKGTTEFTTSWLGNWFTQLMLPKDATGKVTKMKAPKAHSPVAEEVNSQEAIATFISQQELLLQLLEKGRLINLRKATTPVSISRFIQLPVGDTFRFLIAHNYRHVLQARRAIQAAEAAVERV